MHKFFKTTAAAAVASLMILGGIWTADAHTMSATAASDYYDPITATRGEELLGQIHDLITTTHTYYASYNDSKKYGPTTDPALNGESGVVEFYTHETIAEWTLNGSDPGRWNREHVWAQSLSKEPSGRQIWGKEGGGADLHHLRPSEVKMNSDRGNDKYGEVTNGTAVYSKTTSGADSRLGGYHKGGVFEPLDNVKGDVARIVLYVYTHYNTFANVGGTTNGSGSSSYFGTLPITNIISASSEEAAFELLLEWNSSDPVDGIETHRNEEVFKIQHNRNPFIDHPEYADMVWGNAVDPDPDPDPDPEPGPVDPDPDPDPDPEPGPVDPDPEPGETDPGVPGGNTGSRTLPVSAWIGIIAGGVVGFIVLAGVVTAATVAIVLVCRRKK